MTFNEITIAFFASAIALLAATFLIGRINGLKSRGTEENTIEALRKLRTEEEKRYESQISELRDEKEKNFIDRIRAQEAINRWESIKSDHRDLEKMQQELNEFERQESNRIDELERRRAEAATRLRDIQTLLDQYPPELTQDDEIWKEFISKRQKTFNDLQAEIDIASESLDELEEQQKKVNYELEELNSKFNDVKTDLKEKFKSLEKANESVVEAQNTLEKVEEAIAEAQTELEVKKEVADMVSDAKIQFPDDLLTVSIKEMPARSPKNGDKLGAFRNLPDCLREFDKSRVEIEEEDLLKDFENALNKVGLEYSKRIIRAFHTALKVNDLSPLTVLSGLSGTGKSQLPRVYSRFFGINFLHVPVEPGWDSPQDILGFYDFVAERYRPTDRARALGYFDQRFSKEIDIESNQVWSNRMLIILLDEMNLARTEYYFSEFLSRLEMRGPRKGTDQDENSLRNAQIAIDLPYAEGEKPKYLYIPHNVLWVGTLNEDETTQALSDKVLDRANSIRFAPPNPDSLSGHSTAPVMNIKSADGFLSYHRWLEWSNRIREAESAPIDDTLAILARLMQNAGRGFGYRMTQSIKAYVDRYPGADWRVPMIDQINMRLLPKVAGTEIGDCENSLNELMVLCEEDLNDPMFAKSLGKAKEESEVSQVFTWPGYTYEANTK